MPHIFIVNPDLLIINGEHIWLVTTFVNNEVIKILVYVAEPVIEQLVVELKILVELVII